MRTCEHTIQRLLETRTYTAPVAEYENPKAHGGICLEYQCRECEAIRFVNVNQRHTESGPWILAGMEASHETPN